MKKYILTIAALFAGMFLAQAAPGLKISCGPWIQNVTEDSFTILWTTPEKTFSWVEAGVDDGSDWNQKSHTCYFETVSGRKAYGHFHSVKVTGLKKSTTYVYRIVGKTVTDDSNPYAIVYGPELAGRGTHSVKTLDYNATACNFSMVNDIHFNDAKYTALMSGMDRKKTDFIVLNGDIVSFSNSQDTLLKHTFMPIKDLVADFPVIFARGNHETRGSEWYLLPKAFPTSTGEFYYSFRQGPVAFLVLDAGEDKPDDSPEYSGQAAFDQYRLQELEWLKKTVESPEFVNAPQKVCIMHVPTFNDPEAWYSQKWIADNFTPVLNKAGVKLMLAGHHHRYILAKPGEHGNDYTIFVNSNNERLDFSATATQITIKTYDVNGALQHSLNL